MIHSDIKTWLESDSALPTILVEVGVNNGVETTLYLSTNGYVTGGGDTPPNTIYQPYLSDAGGISESVSLGGEISMSVGDIEINNYEGNLDDWLGYTWKNRTIEIFIGDVSWVRSSFRKIFSGLVDGIQETDTGKGLVLNIRDGLESLNTSLSEQRNADGELIPLVFGEVFNMTPQVFDSANLIYQVHPYAIGGIIEVRDGGAPADGVIDDLANGKFTLTKDPYTTITASVHGHLTGGTTYYDDIGNIIKTIIAEFGTQDPSVPVASIDNTNFDAFITDNQQCVGVVYSDRGNLLSTVNELASNVLASVYCSKLGQIRIFQLKEPETTSVFSFNSFNVIENTLEVAEKLPIVAKKDFNYNRNYTVQANTVAGLPAAHAEIFKEDAIKNSSAVNSVALALHRLSTEVEPEQTDFQVKSEADAEAARRVALLGTQRYIYRFTAYREAMLLEVGDTVDMTFDRYNLNGTKGIIMSLDTNLKDGTTVVEIFV